ncbi:unnamed protein product [Lepeophtheirus salmonis]|uniref:(salmon louse) hypothetical protein n=1 Tax=Lepeophtheirus salmonis TaxID=72036 RepID=A0A7R8CGU1_LEPSM|nr:unnamed protein product [Lepeophtheirus salmonis]CAF2818723.1 unnamed protein product [Lepeophtheirus salmonis]
MDLHFKFSPPVQLLFHEQAKSIVALQELQSEVNSLLEFKNILLETYPNLQSKVNKRPSSNIVVNNPINRIKSVNEKNLHLVQENCESNKEISSEFIINNELTQSWNYDGVRKSSAISKDTKVSECCPIHFHNNVSDSGFDEVIDDELFLLLDVIHKKTVKMTNMQDARVCMDQLSELNKCEKIHQQEYKANINHHDLTSLQSHYLSKSNGLVSNPSESIKNKNICRSKKKMNRENSIKIDYCSSSNEMLTSAAECSKSSSPNTKITREKIRKVLKINNVIELQRQLLTTVMEKEVYKTHLEKLCDIWAKKLKEFELQNESLQTSLSNLKLENECLRSQV